VRFAFITAEKAAFPVRLLCRTLHVSRAGVYAWRGRPPAPRARADERLGLEIAAIHAATRQRYGSPRIHAELGERGCRTGRKRVARLMRVRGLAARRRRRFRVTTQSRHPFPIAPNVLARQFERTGPDQAWVTDITYIPTGEGWLYLAVILDLYSRFAVGWAMNERITDDLTLDALGMALARRRPPQGLLHHSDRGSQGGFNWSSQQLEEEELRWPQGGSAALIGRCVRRCARQGAHRWPGASIDSGSGTRSRAGCRAKKRPSRLAPRLPWGHAGSVKLVACQRSVKRHCRSAICLSGSARRSRFFMQQAEGFARSPAS